MTSATEHLTSTTVGDGSNYDVACSCGWVCHVAGSDSSAARAAWEHTRSRVQLVADEDCDMFVSDGCPGDDVPLGKGAMAVFKMGPRWNQRIEARVDTHGRLVVSSSTDPLEITLHASNVMYVKVSDR